MSSQTSTRNYNNSLIIDSFDGSDTATGNLLETLLANGFRGNVFIKFVFRGMEEEGEAIKYKPAKTRLSSFSVDEHGVETLRTVAKSLVKYYASYGDWQLAPMLFISKSVITKILYPPVYTNDDELNCAMKVYCRYVPKGKNGKTISNYFKSINKQIQETGFTEEIAQTINNKYGYGCTMFDRLGAQAFSIESKKHMKHIMLQAFEQHVYEFKNSITDRYFPERVEQFTPTAEMSWYKFAVSICDKGPQFIYRTPLEDMGVSRIIGLKTANVEYKSTDLPLGDFDLVDSMIRSLKAKHPHNFIHRDKQELKWLRMADYHPPTVWYADKAQGYEIDFNQAYRSAAELKLMPDLANKYKFPHYPAFWYTVGPDEQDLALELVTQFSGFAQMTIVLNEERMPKILYNYIKTQQARSVYTSPEIAYLKRFDVKFQITAIAYNQLRQDIDWGFADSHVNPDVNKNANRVLLGRIIARYKHIAQSLICDKNLTQYYVNAIGKDVINVDTSSKECDAIQYDFHPAVKRKQQYHIHAYILTYLRCAMWELLSNFRECDIIKVNIDAIHIKNIQQFTPQAPTTKEEYDQFMKKYNTDEVFVDKWACKSPDPDIQELFGYKVDNSPMGALGCLKLRSKFTPGDRSEIFDRAVNVNFPHNTPLPKERVPQLMTIGGAAGSGKTEMMSKQTDLTCVASFTNKLANNLRKRNEELKGASVQTMHVKYGIEFADQSYKVTRVPADHLHNLDDVLLAPPKMVKNIVKALLKQGKRITITYGPGQATMNKIQSIELLSFLQDKGFKNIMLAGSHRMDPDLYEISERYRNDQRIQQVLELDKQMEPLNKQISQLIASLEEQSENKEAKEKIGELKRIRWEEHIIYKTQLIDEIIADYTGRFRTIKDYKMIEEYTNSPARYTIVTSTNARRLSLNNLIINELQKICLPLHKYRYNTKVKRRDYTRYRSHIEVVIGDPDDNLAQDIKRGYVDDMHITTVHSCQGETIESKIFIDIHSLFDPDIFYSAITRPRHLADITLFMPRSAVKTVKEITPPPELINRVDFDDYSLTRFTEKNILRVDLGGEGGNRAFNFDSYDQYVNSRFVSRLMAVMGPNFNLNEYPSADCKLPTRLWLDIDHVISEETTQKIIDYLDELIIGGDNKVLRSTVGKLHIVLNIEPAQPIEVCEKIRIGGQDKFYPNGEIIYDYSPKGRLAMLLFFKEQLRQIVRDEATDEEWNKAFDMKAKGMNAAYTVKVSSGECINRRYYSPFELRNAAVDDEEKCRIITDCSIYKPITGRINNLAYADIYELAAAYEKKQEDRVNQLKQKYAVYKYNPADNTITKEGIKKEITQDFIDGLIESLPKYLLNGFKWRSVIKNTAVIAQIIPNFDKTYVLHKWSANGKEYNEGRNNEIWQFMYSSSRPEEVNDSLCWLLYNAKY